jgi:phage terminase small subunit
MSGNAKKKPSTGRPKKGGRGFPVNCKGRTRGFSDKHRIFVAEYAINLDHKEAAIKAGYSPRCASSIGKQLLDPKIFPLVARAVEKALALRESLAEHKSDEVLRLLQTGAFLDYREWFLPGCIKDETWKITEEGYKELPKEILRLIKFVEPEMEYQVEKEFDEETGEALPMDQQEPVLKPTGMLLVQLLNKENLLALLSKHMLGDKINVNGNVMQINWSEFRKTTVEVIQKKLTEDPVEAEILAVRQGNAIEDKKSEGVGNEQHKKNDSSNTECSSSPEDGD